MSSSFPVNLSEVRLEELLLEHVTSEYISWLNDPDVVRFTEARFEKHTRESVCKYIQKINASATDRIWRIVVSGRHVGNVKISGICQQHKRAALSILIGDRSVWGRGLASHAIEMASKQSFRDYNLFKLFAGIYSVNQSSIRAFEKAGYVREATLSKHRCFNGRMVDEIRMVQYNTL